jgi:Stage II sporulation protein E (SpoIIE)
MIVPLSDFLGGLVRRAGLFLLLIIVVLPASGQVFDLQAERVPMAELRGLCRFHTGDDPRWSDPSFDDSQWPLLRMDQPWSGQGYKSDSGLAWYRFQIVAPPGHPHLGLYGPGFDWSYEIFIGGQLVARRGGLPPRQRMLYREDGVDPVYTIPDELIPAGKPVEVAVRMWHWPYWTFKPSGSRSPLIVGDAQFLERQRDIRIGENLRDTSGWSFLFAACMLAFFAGLGLFPMRPGAFEYLWFACSELGLAATALFDVYPSAHGIEFRAWQTWNALALLVFNICWATFIVTFLREPRRRTYWTAVAGGAVVSLTFIPFLFQWIPAAVFIPLVYLLSIPMMASLLLLIWIPARRGVLDARLLLGPQVLWTCSVLVQGVIFVLEATGDYSLASLWQNRFDSLVTWPFTFSLHCLVHFLSQTAVLAILILRFARTSRDEERLANEVESARTVQQILVPAENPSIPGFAIESVYRPASEVGGDFFQIVPTLGGGALVVIGDVSGKGVPAAMTVSLLVGTFRTLAHYTQSPGEILAAMNQRMLTRSNGGFTTCLAARIDRDGTLTAANAGHIAPFVDGQECPLDNGLPLGLVSDAAYPERSFELRPGVQLTLLTDGVVEAQKASGELFGFDRATAISTQGADAIAATAQSFGQEDDITVVTLSLARAELLA